MLTVIARQVLAIVLAPAAGVGIAFLALLVDPYTVCAIPLAAFVLGLLAGRPAGVVSGLLLFLAAALTVSAAGNLGEPYPPELIGSFIFFGGFLLAVIGWSAPAVLVRHRGAGPFVAVVPLVLLTGWMAYWAGPHYTHYYQVIVESSEDLTSLELYVPLPMVNGKPYSRVLDNPVIAQAGEHSIEVVETEQGPMARLILSGLQPARRPPNTQPSAWQTPTPVPARPIHRSSLDTFLYIGNLAFKRDRAPAATLTLSATRVLQEAAAPYPETRHTGPFEVYRREAVERFEAPFVAVGPETAKLSVSVESSVWMERYVLGKSIWGSYTERVVAALVPGEGWTFAVGTVTRTREIHRPD